MVPVLATLVFRRPPKERHNYLLEAVKRGYLPALRSTLQRPWIAALGIVAVLGLDLFFYSRIGSEFLPHLNEGALTVHAQLPPTVSFQEAKRLVDGVHGDRIDQPGLSEILRSFPEVETLAVELGRPDDGTDPSGYYNVELNMFLRPRSQWRPRFHGDRAQLADAVSAALRVVPGVDFGISQRISDNVEEAMNGVKGELAVKVVGPDLNHLDDLARSVARAISAVPGLTDVAIDTEVGQSNLQVELDRESAERYGLSVGDVEDVVESGMRGVVATQIVEGERKHDLVVRFAERVRTSLESVRRLRVPLPGDGGGSVPLGEIATVATSQRCRANHAGRGRALHRRDLQRARARHGFRREAGPDCGRRQGAAAARLSVRVGREFASERRASERLAIVVPVTIGLILVLLLLMFGRLTLGLIVLGSALVASPVGGLCALWITGTSFSVSSGVGFLALFGVSVQTGVILVTYMEDLREGGLAPDEAILRAAELRLRPVMMTALVASLGLLPAAVSTAIGSDSQRPLAIVVVGGLISSLSLSVFLLPVLYRQFAVPRSAGA